MPVRIHSVVASGCLLVLLAAASGPAVAQPAVKPAPKPAAAPADPQSAVPQNPRFDITGYRVQGNTVLRNDEVSATLKSFVGKQRDFGDVQQALEALQALYQRRGYGAAVVYLPEQSLTGGVVQLNVIEPRIGKVTVTGNRRFSTANVRRALPDLREGTVPNITDIAENSRAANENPARQLQVVLKPGEKEGVVDAAVEVKDENPLRAFATLDNTGTRSTGRNRLGLGMQYANLWNRDHIGTLQVMSSPGHAHEVQIYSLGYRFPIPSMGDSMDWYLGRSAVNAAETQTPAGALKIIGKGVVGGGKYNVNLRRRGEYEHRVIAGLDYRRLENQCSLGAFGAAGCTTASSNPSQDITLRPANLGYAGQWSEPGSQIGFNLSVARNIPGGANGDQATFDAVRAGSSAAYTVWRYGLQFGRSLFGSEWQLRLAFNGQRASQLLVPAEQFGIGGYSSVRGFQEREALGDHGRYGNFELYTPNLWRQSTPAQGVSVRALLFFDGGTAYVRDPLPTQASQLNITSRGLGLRAAAGRNFSLRLDFATVVNAHSSLQEKRGDRMVHGGLLLSY